MSASIHYSGRMEVDRVVSFRFCNSWRYTCREFKGYINKDITNASSATLLKELRAKNMLDPYYKGRVTVEREEDFPEIRIVLSSTKQPILLIREPARVFS